MREQKRRCFLIGPIGPVGSEIRKHADMFLHGVVKHALEGERLNYVVTRADEVADPGMITDRVINDIIHSELAVADLTYLNPNVFYELGIRHSSEKPVIHFARTGTELPFDNLGHRIIIEDITDWHGIERARQSLVAAAEVVDQPDYRVSNPITQSNASFKMIESADPKDRIIFELQERVKRLERSEELSKSVGAHMDLVNLARKLRMQHPDVFNQLSSMQIVKLLMKYDVLGFLTERSRNIVTPESEAFWREVEYLTSQL